MLLLQFIHAENELTVGKKSYKATCIVRNEINGYRKTGQVVKTYPINGDSRKPYYPRKFPTGLWRVKKPIWTDDIDYSPVKIPTDAFRGVLIWDADKSGYTKITDKHQTDSFYHLHFAKNSRTTLGCIRLNNEKDAEEIAKLVEFYLNKKQEVWIEVLASKE